MDWTGCPDVESDPDKLGGTPILNRSRMPADGIVENYAEGMSVEEIADEFQHPAPSDASALRILFDNNVPRSLRHRLRGHEIDAAEERGWEQLKNGDLLRTAESDGYDLCITGDKNIRYQQNLKE